MSIRISLKATFLIAVFLWNTAVGFACTTGLGFHKGAHSHHLHQHQKDNCCKDEVTKLVKDDKLMHSNLEFHFQPLFFISLNPFICINKPGIYFTMRVFNVWLMRPARPPIADLRIAIQSFQI